MVDYWLRTYVPLWERLCAWDSTKEPRKPLDHSDSGLDLEREFSNIQRHTPSPVPLWTEKCFFFLSLSRAGDFSPKGSLKWRQELWDRPYNTMENRQEFGLGPNRIRVVALMLTATSLSCGRLLSWLLGKDESIFYLGMPFGTHLENCGAYSFPDPQFSYLSCGLDPICCCRWELWKANEHSDRIVSSRGLFLTTENSRSTIDFENFCLVTATTTSQNNNILHF